MLNININESTKQYKEFIDKIKDDMVNVNINGIPASIFENIYPKSTWIGGKYNPCEHCPNNPKNNPFSSGFCNCALPALYNPIY